MNGAPISPEGRELLDALCDWSMEHTETSRLRLTAAIVLNEMTPEAFYEMDRRILKRLNPGLDVD